MSMKKQIAGLAGIMFAFLILMQLMAFMISDEAKVVVQEQYFVDANGVRCLMSDTIAGDKCPYNTTGVNLNTGKYYTGASPMAKLTQEIYGLDDPYEHPPITKRP